MYSNQSDQQSQEYELLTTQIYTIQPKTTLNRITDRNMRKIHETSTSVVQKLLAANNAKFENLKGDKNCVPHQFSKNILTRAQLNEMIDMKEVRKLIRKRGSTQIETDCKRRVHLRKNSRAVHKEQQKLDRKKMALSIGSGLVL